MHIFRQPPLDDCRSVELGSSRKTNSYVTSGTRELWHLHTAGQSWWEVGVNFSESSGNGQKPPMQRRKRVSSVRPSDSSILAPSKRQFAIFYNDVQSVLIVNGMT